ncbi:MAG: ABC transporter permease [Elusimicrobiota bacterium]|nr:ABC transporter permease [Endomicrobiia bacterium]MDW8165733.1 ABC transporter permease [Elusimicrobiota bacterium]
MRTVKTELLKIYAYIFRNYIFAIRNVFTFFDILFWPVIGILSVGVMSDFLNLEKNLISFLLTGAITSGVLQVAQLEVSYGILYEIWSKSIKQIFISPTKIYQYIIGSWIVGIARGILVFILLSFLSHYLFGFYIPDYFRAIVFLVGIFMNALIIGLLVNFFVLLYGQRVDIIAWSLSVLAMLICGIYYPVNILPKWLQTIAQLIPLTYFLEYYRESLSFSQNFSFGLTKGFILCVFYIFIFFYLISLAYNRAKKTGMILKLSE